MYQGVSGSSSGLLENFQPRLGFSDRLSARRGAQHDIPRRLQNKIRKFFHPLHYPPTGRKRQTT